MPKIKRSSSEPSSLCYIGLSYQEELNKSPNTPSHHGIPTGNTTGAEAAFHISGKTILSWGYAAMECVIESVMELMVDTHCTLWCVCVWEIIFIIVIIIIIIFLRLWWFCFFTVRPVTCHLVLLVGHRVSIVVVYNKVEKPAVDKSKWMTLWMIKVDPII